MNSRYNRFRRLCSWTVGVVFTLSGILKLMDPVGAGLVMDEYWRFFHISFLHPVSQTLGTALALVEAVCGIALVTGVWRKFFLVVTAALMLFFTALTAILAVFNPPMDCGCFGEAIHLTNLQTFLKNIVLDALLLGAMIPFRDFGVPRRTKYGSFFLVSVSVLAFSIYSLLFLPVKDFTDYRQGAQLLAARSEAEETMFESSFIYEKDGEERVFTLDEELPDSSWTFVRAQTSENDHLQKAVSLPVRPKNLPDSLAWEGGADSLVASGNVLVVSVHSRRGLSDKRRAAADRLLKVAEEAGVTPVFLDLSPEEHGDYEYMSDYRSLVGLNRSDGGATFIQDGFIVRKWSFRKYPDMETLSALADGEATETIVEELSRGDQLFQAVLLYIFAVLLLF